LYIGTLACLLRFVNPNLGLSAKIRKSLSMTTDASVKGVLTWNLGLSAEICISESWPVCQYSKIIVESRTGSLRAASVVGASARRLSYRSSLAIVAAKVPERYYHTLSHVLSILWKAELEACKQQTIAQAA
jgi:hypothetical protein